MLHRAVYSKTNCVLSCNTIYALPDLLDTCVNVRISAHAACRSTAISINIATVMLSHTAMKSILTAIIHIQSMQALRPTLHTAAPTQTTQTHTLPTPSLILMIIMIMNMHTIIMTMCMMTVSRL